MVKFAVNFYLEETFICKFFWVLSFASLLAFMDGLHMEMCIQMYRIHKCFGVWQCFRIQAQI